VLIHDLHAELPAGLHGRVDLVGLSLSHEVAHRRRGDEDLGRNGAALAPGQRNELLRHDPCKRAGELNPDL